MYAMMDAGCLNVENGAHTLPEGATVSRLKMCAEMDNNAINV